MKAAREERALSTRAIEKREGSHWLHGSTFPLSLSFVSTARTDIVKLVKRNWDVGRTYKMERGRFSHVLMDRRFSSTLSVYS